MENVTPQSLITEAHIKEVLKADKGSNAILESWKVVDFTKPGDNYACVVTSVEVKYLMENQNCDATYIVKLNSLRNMEGFTELTPVLFEKEGGFYQEIVPPLNEILISIGQPPLRFPKCYHVSLEDEKEQIYFEDLRAKGFKMFDRRKGMDKDHSVLVLKELARLHSASYLFKGKFQEGETPATKYDFLAKGWMNFTPNSKEVFVPVFEKGIDTGVQLLEKVGGYEISTKWLHSLKCEIETILSSYMKRSKFNIICHGDCWNNNILFRYNDEGHPLEVMFVDLQVSQETTVAYDLNYFLYTSLTGEVRKSNLDHFISVYYSSCKEVLDGDNVPMYYTREELLKEFRSQNKLGVLFIVSFIGMILAEPEEVPELTDTDWETVMKDVKEKSLEKLKTDALFRQRFLSVFDELMETGLIS